MAWIRQTSFHSGEVAPHVSARSDLDARRFALRRARNFIIGPTGRAMNRPGFQFCTEVKDSTHKVRLIPFTFSTSQSYVLEFGHQYVRVLQGGGWVLNGANPVEIATPWLDVDLPRLQFAQCGDILTVCHPSYIPRQIKRVSQSSWTISNYQVTRTVSPPATISVVNKASGGYDLQTTDDATHLARPWEWVATLVYNGEESLPSPVLAPGKVVVAPDKNVMVSVTAGSQSYERVFWYRGRYGIWGYVGSTKTTSFVDEGQTPNYSDTPPTPKDPFANSQFPSVVAYHQQRAVFGNLRDSPQRIISSQTGNLYKFDSSLPLKADDPLDFTLASQQYEEVRAIVSLKHLLVLTANAEYAVDSGSSSALTPTTTGFQRSSVNGSAWVRPLIVNNAILYVQAQQASVRDLTYDYRVDGWTGGDVSVSAPHLLSDAGRTIVDWCYARFPYSVVWAVRDDGKLLALTYSQEMDTRAWTWHDTAGTFESICSVPEGSESAVYAIVLRSNGKRYIERMATRQVNDVRWTCFLDASVFYDGTYGGGARQVFTGLGHLEGKTVTALGDGANLGTFTVSGGSINVGRMVTYATIGLPYQSELELLDLDSQQVEMRALEKNISRVVFEVDSTAGLAAGESFNELYRWTPELGHPTSSSGLYTEQLHVNIASSWNRYGRACLRVVDPLPVTVVAVSREAEFE